MASPVSLRLDKETRRRVAQVARLRSIPPSQVMREAIMTTVAERPAPTPYELMADLIGTARGGDRKRSEGIGRK
jgi:predicted DNA-binding protein